MAASEPYIAIVSKGFQHQFWQAVKQGAEAEAKAEGARITFEGPPTEQDIEQQVTMLTNAIQKKPDALGFAALDSKASAPLMDQAKSQDIPVIAFDSGVESDVPLTTAATDNKAAAAEAAKHMSELIGGKGKVALVVHDQTSRTGIDRRDGFTEWMKANAPGIELLPVQYGGGDQAKSADIAKSIISSNPDLKGFYGANEGSAIGIVKGVAGERQEGHHDRRLRLGQGAARRDPQRRDGRRDHAEPGRDGQGARRVRDEGDQGRAGAEGHRHRLLLVRQDQHRRPEDQGRPVRMSRMRAVLAAAAVFAAAAVAPAPAGADPATTLWYDEAATNWESRSLPIGNGALGASVFGGVASEQLTFNEKTLWTGGPGSAGYSFGNWTSPRPGALEEVQQRINAEKQVDPTWVGVQARAR